VTSGRGAAESALSSREEYEQRKATKRARQQAERGEVRRKGEIQAIEAEILNVDETLENVAMQMEDTGEDAARLLSLSRQYELLAAKKAELYKKWEDLIVG
jgi:superfamily I DNA and RNA helicase